MLWLKTLIRDKFYRGRQALQPAVKATPPSPTCRDEMKGTKRKPLPIPTLEMRELVGPTDPSCYDNPDGKIIFPDVPLDLQESIFDFGCGCGRLARKLIQQKARPKRYLGIDLHKGMINWCHKNLAPYAPSFIFVHYDVYNMGFNPSSKHTTLPLPADSNSFQLVLAWSVFTHLVESSAVFFLKQVARILAKRGRIISTWFFFNKRDYPMMQEFQNALYINDVDPTNAVIFDLTWFQSLVHDCGLKIIQITPPKIRGFQWEIHLAHIDSQYPEQVDFPADDAPVGIARPPASIKDPQKIGIA